MNMIDIQKLQNGRRVSRSDYAEAKRAYDQAYAAADDDTKAKLDGLMQSSLNFSSANPMNNRSAREYQTLMYRNALSIINGDATPSVSPGVSTPNMFNGYSHIENENNANDVTARYMAHAKGSAGSGSGSSKGRASKSGSGNGYYKYNWANGLDSDWGFETDNLDDRIASFADALSQNIGAALSSGKTILGADANQLQQAAAGLQSGAWQGNIKELARIAKLAGVSAEAFKGYFGELFPGLDQQSKNKKARIAEGWEFVDGGDYGEALNQKIAQNGWIVGKKNGQTYLLNKDYSGPVTGQSGSYMDTDWRHEGSTLGHGWAINQDGAFIYGDLNPYFKDELSTWNPVLKKYIEDQKNSDRWSTNGNLFNQYTSWSDNTANSDLIDKHAAALNGKDIADVSSYFNGADVIATVKGNKFDGHVSDFGHLKINDKDFTFYWLDKQGNPQSGTYEQAVRALGDINTSYKNGKKGLEEYLDSSRALDGLQWNIDQAEDDYDINGYGEHHNWWTPGHYYNNPWDTSEVTAGDTSMHGHHSKFGSIGTVQNSPDKFARLMLATFMERDRLGRSSYNDDKELLRTLNLWMTKNPLELLRVIRSAQLSGALDKDPRYAQAFVALQKTLKSALQGSTPTLGVVEVKAQKQGGIIKAALGTGLDINGQAMEPEKRTGSIASGIRNKVNSENQKLNRSIDRAQESGRDVMNQIAIDLNTWTSSDTLRATALATDIAGLVAAMASPATSGLGSAVAIGTGFGSMAMDAIADFTDDKVSTGQAWKNIGINTGLALAQAVGGKAPKILKSAIKLLPKAVVALGVAGVALDPEIQGSIDKAIHGKNLNVNDWRNLMWVMKTTTGLGTMGAIKYKGVKGKKIYDEKVKQNVDKLVVDSQLSNDIKYVGTENGGKAIAIDKTLYKNVNDALGKNDLDGARAMLIGDDANPGPLKDQPDLVDQIITSIAKEKKGWKEKMKFWKDADQQQKLRDASVEQIENATGADIYAEARLQAIQDLRQQARTQSKYNWVNQLEAKPFVESFNPALGAAMNDAQARGWTGKTVDDLIDYQKEGLTGMLMSGADSEMGNVSDKQAKAMAESIRKNMKAKGDNLRNNSGLNTAVSDLHAKQQAALTAEADMRNAEAAFKDAQAKVKEIDDNIAQLNDAIQKHYISKLEGLAKIADARTEKRRLNQILKQAEADFTTADNALKGAAGGQDYVKYNQDIETGRAALESDITKKKDAIDLFLKEDKYKKLLVDQTDPSKGLRKMSKKETKDNQAFIDAFNDYVSAKGSLDSFNADTKNQFIGGTEGWNKYKVAAEAKSKAAGDVSTQEALVRDLRKQIARDDTEHNAKIAERNTKNADRANRVSIQENARKNFEGLRKNAAAANKGVQQAEGKLKGINSKLKSDIAIERSKEVMKRGKAVGTTHKEVTVKADGADVKVPSGAKVKSYKYLRDSVKAKEAILSNANMKELSKSELAKIIPSPMMKNVEGGAVNVKTGEIAIWKQGGKMNKFAHLRH